MTKQTRYCSAGYVVLSVLVAVSFVSILRADVVVWNAPDLDTWTYPEASSPGQRTLGPTFLTSPELDENDQFVPSPASDPARRGMAIVAFDTASEIQSGFDASRYSVHSVTVEFTMQSATAGSIHYDPTPETNAELLDDFVTGNIDTARPMELYGVGFQDGYTGFEYGGGAAGPPLFSEAEFPYANGSLVAYPIASDASGEPVDVSNSLTGGYSATATSNNTGPFDPTAWSIGTAAGLNPGDVIPNGTTFSFSVDLTELGVIDYMRQSLSEGSLGFVLSSPHFTGDPHSGTIIPYPQWYLKEYPTGYGGVPPSLTVDYSILPLPGDFDDDGDVDAVDLAQWEGDFGVNADSDSDGDGDSDGADFLAWQQNFGGASSAFVVVPEPSTVLLLLLGGVCVSTVCRRTRAFRSRVFRYSRPGWPGYVLPSLGWTEHSSVKCSKRRGEGIV